MEAVNIELPRRNKKGRFSDCILNQRYHFKMGEDFQSGKQDVLRSSAAAFAKNKKWKAETNYFEKDTEITINGKSETIKAGVYVKFINPTPTIVSDTAVIPTETEKTVETQKS